MSENKETLKPCPWNCGGKLEESEGYVTHECHSMPTIHHFVMTVGDWNQRPEEDRLRAENKGLSDTLAGHKRIIDRMDNELTAARKEIEWLREITNQYEAEGRAYPPPHPTCETCGNECEEQRVSIYYWQDDSTVTEPITYCSTHTALNTDEKEG